MGKKQNVLVVGSVWPEPNSSAAGSRMLQLLKLFLANNWQVAFSSPALGSGYSFDLESIGISKHSGVYQNSSLFMNKEI